MHQMIKYSFLLLCLMIIPVTQASPSCDQWKAKVISVQGKVDFQRSGDSYWILLKQGDKFCSGDMIRTSRHSRATIQLDNNTIITLNQSTTLNFSMPEVKTSSWFIDLFEGAAFFRSRQQQKLNIQTPFINAAHEGTEFLVTVNSKQTTISVFDGQVSASNKLGKISIKKGFKGVANNNEAPKLQALKINLQDAVQWTLYYPPIIDIQDYQSTFQPVINAYRQGNIQQAIALLDSITEKHSNTSYLSLKSSLLLSIGRVDEASTLLDSLLKLESKNSTAFALQSIIAIAKNQKDKARLLAQQAVTLSPQSAVAHIALSYAHQAHFDIASAQSSVETAVNLSPKNSLAWARLAELQLSSADHQNALKSATKAQQLNPNLGRTLSILGFSHLAQINIKQAETAFKLAITKDSSDPLTHLGLGLAKIRSGNIIEGTRDIETAASLDPNNSTMRSYLGKAYYEQNNNQYASTELAIAKEVDPNDPTPWFYDGILKQSTNRPIEALHDMQKAIELNDNRGVYRSKLLLDEDAAARSVNLSRIYQDLGFDRVALKQSWNALALNPTDHSAHRYLSDSLQGKPFYRIARASELLQAQLLQPINITPVQPQLTTDNISVLNSTGPSSLSSGEYDPLFSTNGAKILVNGAYGSNNTLTNNAIISAVYNKLSLSMGQFHFQTDGFRTNDDYKQDIYNAFVQYTVTPNLSFQFELKSEDIRAGDVPFRLNNFHQKNLSESIEHDTSRFGLHYKISPAHDILVSTFYTSQKETENNDTLSSSPIVQLNVKSKAKSKIDGYQLETQYIFHPSAFNFTLGIGYLELNNNTTINTDSTLTFIPPFLPPISSVDKLTSQDKTKYFNTYLYTQSEILPSLTSIVGLSFDSFKEGTNKTEQFNPKAGLIWKPINQLSFRGAIIRNLKRPLASNQTIEPTQVAGFNQLFDGNNGSSVWQYSLGIDFNPAKAFFIGGEINWRDIKKPLLINNNLTTQDKDETLYFTYAYWAPLNWLSLSAEYHFEKFKREFETNNIDPLDPQSVSTHTIPLSIHLFEKHGFFSTLSATYIKQNTSFVRDISTLAKYSDPLAEINSNFWTFDSSIGYRFPKKIGNLSFEIKNMFDNSYVYHSIFDASGPQLSPFTPEREFFIKLSLFY